MFRDQLESRPEGLAGIASTPLPRDVEGFEAAVALGQTPQRPASPPRLLQGSTAKQIGQPRLWAFMGIFIWSPILILAKDALDAINRFLILFLILGYVAVMLYVLISRIRPYREKLVLEMQAGYTTERISSGDFWNAKHRFVEGKRKRKLLWDVSGCWLLNKDGQVLAEPDLRVDPPGIYPSPHRSGEAELWTGVEWAFVNPEKLGQSDPKDR